jgi:hypothetical protein
VLVEAVEPVSELIRTVGRSLQSPVRPITTATADALNNLLGELPEPDSIMLPGMREMMPAPMQKRLRMQPVRPSS